MNINSKLNWTLVSSILAVVLSTTILLMWCCNAGGFSVVSLDTFVGVIVALLAIIVTVAIGWQIYAAMDLRSNIAKLDKRIQEVEILSRRMEDQEQKTRQYYYESQHYNHIALAEIFKSSEMFDDAFRFYMKALKYDLQTTKPLNVSPIIASLRGCVNSITENTKLSTPTCDSIIEIDTSIRKLPLFCMIKDDYDDVFNIFKDKVNLPNKK